MKIVAVSVILVLIILQSGIGFWQNRTIQLQNGSMETVIRDMAQRMENMEQALKETPAKGAKLEKQIEEMVQERNNVAVAVLWAISLITVSILPFCSWMVLFCQNPIHDCRMI